MKEDLLKKPEVQEIIRKVALRIQRARKVEERWTNKFHSLSKEQRRNLVIKMMDKYNSQEYQDRHRKGGNGPAYPLKDLLYQYSKKYGELYEEGFDSPLVHDSRIVDGSIIVKRHGMVITVIIP